jgi:hypothetical protein
MTLDIRHGSGCFRFVAEYIQFPYDMRPFFLVVDLRVRK